MSRAAWITGRAYFNKAEGQAWLRLHGCWLTADGEVLDSCWASPYEMVRLESVSP